MPAADLDVVLFYASLVLSLAAVFLFLWLMREPSEPEAGRPEEPLDSARGRLRDEGSL